MMAAQRTGRIAYGIELDPLYVDVAIKRWQAVTGATATLAGDGRSFVEHAATRAAHAGVSDESRLILLEEACHG